MAVTIGDITFDGMIGTIQRPKPTFEKYTRLGADQVYFQRLRTESTESNVEMWKVCTSNEEARSHERALANNLGTPLAITIDENPPIFGVFVSDYTHTIKAGQNGKFLLRYFITLVCDEKSGVSG